MNILAAADALSHQQLLTQLDVLARQERAASAHLVAHLAALATRPDLYASEGYGSLFSYCTEALRLSEDAACNRIQAAKACRRFPALLDLLVSGSMTLTSVRILGPHLTAENHALVLESAKGRTRRQIEALVAALAPRPDIAAGVRKLPAPTAPPAAADALIPPAAGTASHPEAVIAPPVRPAAARPVVQARSPERYRVQFTIGEETHARLPRVQALLRREIPDGDPGAIFDRALKLLEAQIEKTKLGAAARPRQQGAIRPGTDRKEAYKSAPASRHIPAEVSRRLPARRRPMRLRLGGRPAVHRADVPGVPSCPAVRARRRGHRGEHLCFVAGGTTNTRRSSSSERAVLPTFVSLGDPVTARPQTARSGRPREADRHRAPLAPTAALSTRPARPHNRAFSVAVPTAL